MGTLSLGDVVQGIGIGSGAMYEGRLVRFPERGRVAHRIRVTRVHEAKAGTANPGDFADIINVKKLGDNVSYAKNLIGPVPKPVEEPKFIPPFHNDGGNVLDSRSKVVTRVLFGGYATGSYRQELPMSERYELARIIAEALTEKYKTTVEDSKSPF